MVAKQAGKRTFGADTMRIIWRIVICVLVGFAAVLAAVAYRRLTGYDGSQPYVNMLLTGGPGILVLLTWWLTRRSN